MSRKAGAASPVEDEYLVGPHRPVRQPGVQAMPTQRPVELGRQLVGTYEAETDAVQAFPGRILALQN